MKFGEHYFTYLDFCYDLNFGLGWLLFRRTHFKSCENSTSPQSCYKHQRALAQHICDEETRSTLNESRTAFVGSSPSFINGRTESSTT